MRERNLKSPLSSVTLLETLSRIPLVQPSTSWSSSPPSPLWCSEVTSRRSIFSVQVNKEIETECCFQSKIDL